MGNKTAKISLIVSVYQDDSNSMIAELPSVVTISLPSNCSNFKNMVEQSTKFKHEFVVDIPMESLKNKTDGLKNVLCVGLSADENIKRLESALSNADGCLGIINTSGDRFVLSVNDLKPIVKEIKNRKLAFINACQSTYSSFKALAFAFGMSYGICDLRIDYDLRPESIDKSLSFLEVKAKEQGTVIAVGTAYPMILERIKKWIPSLEKKGIVLVPVSASITPGS